MYECMYINFAVHMNLPLCAIMRRNRVSKHSQVRIKIEKGWRKGGKDQKRPYDQKSAVFTVITERILTNSAYQSKSSRVGNEVSHYYITSLTTKSLHLSFIDSYFIFSLKLPFFFERKCYSFLEIVFWNLFSEDPQ